MRALFRWLHRRRCRHCREMYQARKEFEARQQKKRLERLGLVSELVSGNLAFQEELRRFTMSDPFAMPSFRATETPEASTQRGKSTR